MKNQKKHELRSVIRVYTLIISTLIIFLVQTVSILILSSLMVSDINREAAVISDELVVVFQEPLYNVDDHQVVRIGEALLFSGRISGIEIESSASGVLLSKLPAKMSEQIKPVVRSIYYKNIFLGRLVLHFSPDDWLKTIGRFILIMLFIAFMFISINLLMVNRVIKNSMAKAFEVLMKGIYEIASGNYHYVTPLTDYADMNAIIELQNDMASKIQKKNMELVELNENLEIRVAQRTMELHSSMETLRKMQNQLVETEKMTALGQIATGIAHELNSPLGAISSANNTIVDYIETCGPDFRGFFTSLDPEQLAFYAAVIDAGFANNRTLGQLVFVERKLVRKYSDELKRAGIEDHEEIADLLLGMNMENRIHDFIPQLGIERCLEILKFASKTISVKQMTVVISESTAKAARVIDALRSYLKKEKVNEKYEIVLSENISQVLTLLGNMLKQGIEVKTEYSDIIIEGQSDRLTQVWMNLIRNSVQAMHNSGELTITTELKNDKAYIHIADNGPGIDPELQKRIFEPFFTTKEQGEGMGLGLDICRRILKSMHGDISVRSKPGETVFTVKMPGKRGKDKKSEK